jgi:hypothetical protein
MLETAGNCDIPKLKFFSEEKLVRSGNTLVPSATSFYRPALLEAGIIEASSVQSFFAGELLRVTRIQVGDHLMFFQAPHVPLPVDGAGRPVELLAHRIFRQHRANAL